MRRLALAAAVGVVAVLGAFLGCGSPSPKYAPLAAPAAAPNDAAKAAATPSVEREPAPTTTLPPPPSKARDWSATAARVEQLARAELEQKKIPALAIALIAGGATVATTTLGFEDAERATPASRETVWRAGSVSKMFTDLAVMRLVESGRLDLDAPVTKYLPEFSPRNPFVTPITLRQLMAHRAGLVREPPVGSYFDASSPSLAATISSLQDTTLVYAPATRTKYSNAGIAVVGRVLEVVSGRPFADCVREQVLEPMGLRHSAFLLAPGLRPRLAHAQMWTYWGTTSEAPGFELGMAPCGSLYSTIDDLAQAAKVFLAGGVGPSGAVVKRESLAEMWRPQFTPVESRARSGFGLGFYVDEFAGTRRVGHDGAIYGFSTILALLPELDVAVVAVGSMDVAHGSLQKVTDDALSCMARVARGELPPPPVPRLQELGKARAVRLAGRYRSADGRRVIGLLEQGGELWLDDRARRARLRVDAGEPALLVADDLVFAGTRLRILDEGERLAIDGVELARLPAPRPPPPPDPWRGLIGEYGFDHNVLFVFEQEGELHALIEWFFDYPLMRESDDVWSFPDYGLYFGEKIVFRRGADGVARQAVTAGVVFPRRNVGTPEGVTFQIAPARPIAELRAAALAASPPEESGRREPQLVDLGRLDPTLRFDVRYATTNNFLATKFYDEPRAFLQKPAAEALARVQQSLAREGFGILVHDAYRPWFVTKMFWDATPPEHHEMVADPGKGSRHNRGCAIDLTLCDGVTGRPLRMPSGYDEFSLRANPWYPGGTSEERWLRDLLRRAMESEGFTVYEHEWWHFDFGEWREYPVMNRTFSEIPEATPR